MKTFKQLLLIVLSTMLFYSCYQDKEEESFFDQQVEELALERSQSTQIPIGERSFFDDSFEEMGLEQMQSVTMPITEGSSRMTTCVIEVCIDIQADGEGRTGIYLVDLPDPIPNIVIRNGLIYPTGFPGPSFPYPDPGPYCIDIEVDGEVPVTLRFKGAGSVETTINYPSGNSEVVFQVGDITDDEVEFGSVDLIIECEPEVIPDVCIIEVCIDIQADGEGRTGIYLVDLPGNIPNIVIRNGIIYPTGYPGPSFPYPDPGPYCLDIEVDGSVPVTLRFKGAGSVMTTVQWPNSDPCEVFQVGETTDDEVEFGNVDLVLTCEPTC